ncbi:hypothetical protein O181_121437 [Austropuccinia psidii MF-1]|uniref:Uncharacterized protein n=1 Tax=Austropuccinia psidii MF-1 TaxID=1389203 RepID=A0A9Q3Q3F3_9BASI|nr:hypothetical protein [Austropuccinia psidii MF-1]
MESWPSFEENPWSMDTNISWIEEKEVWANYNNPQELNENPDWFLKTKPEPCPDISTIVLPYIEFENIFEKEKSPSETIITHTWEELPGFNLTKYELLETLEIHNGMKSFTWINTSENHYFGGPGNAKIGSTPRILELKMGKSARSQEIILLIGAPGTATGKKPL